MNWTLSDFIVAGILITALISAIAFVSKKVHGTNTKLALIGGSIALFVYVWAELAVGIFFNFGS